MAKKDNQKRGQLPDSGLPTAPAIFIVNSMNGSNVYIEALNSIIPGDNMHVADDDYRAMTYWFAYSTKAERAAEMARECQLLAMLEGRNMTSVAICDNRTSHEYSKLGRDCWPTNHITVNVHGLTPDETARRIVNWLFTVLPVPETLYLIPESRMLEIDTRNYPKHRYCAVKDIHKYPLSAKVQFVALIASKPRVCEPKTLSWTVIDRSGTATFFFHHHGPSSQRTWDWVQSFQVGDRQCLPRVPMLPLFEPIMKSVVLSPFRFTGGTIRGVGNATVGLGKGVHWIGEQVTCRKNPPVLYLTKPEYLEMKMEIKEERERKQREKQRRGCRFLRKFRKGDGKDKSGSEKCGYPAILEQEQGTTWGDMMEENPESVGNDLEISENEKVAGDFC